MKRSLASVLFVAALATIASCGTSLKSHIKVDDVALGRVVVYRNGVAFYERHAFVKGGRLTVVVPRDRVDDFLKSLTVVDAKTREPLPVSFPRDQGDHGQYVEMSLQVSTGDAEVLLTYVTESPAWKPSYRLVVGDGAKKGTVMIEGWAIVDNTSGEDWNDVILGVGSSSAMSFRYDLWTVKTVARQTLASQDSFAVAPPTAQSSYAQQEQGAENVVANLDDSEIRRPVGHPDYVDPVQPAPTSAGDDYGYAVAGSAASDEEDYDVEVADKPSRGGGGKRAKGHKASKKRVAKADPKPTEDGTRMVVGGAPSAPPPRDTRAGEGDAKVKQLADQLRANGQKIVVEGYADPSDPNADQSSMDRANMVRNQLIDNGVPPAQVRVVNRGVVAGQAAGARIVGETAEVAQAGPTPVDDDAPPVGESHFVAEKPMTVGAGTSVMASMLREQAQGEVAYLYDAESERGNDRFAFLAVRIENPTGYTLEPGPVTVYGDGRVIGEGLTEPIPPHANVVIPFALDRQIVIERLDEQENRVSRLVTLQRGILTAEVQHIKKTQLTITSRLREDTTVYVRHTVGKGWSLLDAPETFERIADAYLFAVPLQAGKTAMVEISEATPLTRTLDLHHDTTLDMMKVFVETAEPGPELAAQLKELLGVHRELVDGKEKMDSLRRRASEYRVRMDELTAQILTLKSVKHGGDLLKHLDGKLKDISNRVQKATIEIVDTEERLMLSKVKFQDLLAELHLTDAMAPAPAKRTPSTAGGGSAAEKAKGQAQR